MHGERRLKILEVINENLNAGLCELQDHIIGFFTAGYGASLSKLEFKTNQAYKKRILREIEQNKINKLKRELYRLKRDGLLENNKLTKKGLEKLNKLKKKFHILNFKKEPSANPIIIIFDIPEKLSGKRKWLRQILGSLGYQMIQKSVWLGTNKFPKEFIEDIKNNQLLSYVKMFRVFKEGTLFD